MGDLIKCEPRHDGKSSLKMARITELCLELEATKQELERTRAELRQAKRDAEPVRHGKWEMNTNPNSWYFRTVSCSECSCTNSCGVTPYCPNCGAKMDKEE